MKADRDDDIKEGNSRFSKSFELINNSPHTLVIALQIFHNFATDY